MKGRKSLFVAVVLAIFSTFVAYAIPSRPEPQRLINDFAGLLSPSQRQALENMLVEFDDSTSNQIAVITTLDLEGYEIAEYATRIGLEWQVGSEKFDNGIVIAVKPKTQESGGKVFIATGYGLEGAVPDAYAKRIIEREMIPHFMNEDYYGGIRQACITLMKLASGEISEPREEEEDSIWILISMLIIMFFVFVVIAVALENHNDGKGPGGRGPVIYTGPIITSGRNYGSFGGSSFGGGFGGFGGGSFGGGGAGGSW